MMARARGTKRGRNGGVFPRCTFPLPQDRPYSGPFPGPVLSTRPCSSFEEKTSTLEGRRRKEALCPIGCADRIRLDGDTDALRLK